MDGRRWRNRASLTQSALVALPAGEGVRTARRSAVNLLALDAARLHPQSAGG